MGVLGVGIAAKADVIDLRPTEVDLTVQVVSAGDGSQLAAERVLVRPEDGLLTVLADATAVEGEVTFARVSVVLPRTYIVSAWVDGVGYHVRHTGQAFADGTPAVVHAFELTDSTEGLTITGMNLVIRQREGGFGFEAVVTVDNQSRPQRTVRADALPLRLALPEGLDQTTVEVDDGPEPFAASLRPAGALTGVVAAVPPGKARITVKGVVAADAELAFSPSFNLPVEAWSLLVWPGDLQVDSFDLQQDREGDYGGFGRWQGRALEPGQTVDVRVGSPPPADATPVFSDSPTMPPAANRRPTAVRTGVPWITIVVAVVLLGAYAVWRRRR
jgi:hypothetical protein